MGRKKHNLSNTPGKGRTKMTIVSLEFKTKRRFSRYGVKKTAARHGSGKRKAQVQGMWDCRL